MMRRHLLPFILLAVGCSHSTSAAADLAARDAENVELQTLTQACTAALSPWSGSLRKLPEQRGDLLTFIANHPHPSSYEKVASTSPRYIKFQDFMTVTLDAIDAMRADSSKGDWCGVKAKALDAGYSVVRYYDTGPGRPKRYYIYAHDTLTADQQAFIVLNPTARRNIVIENAHPKDDACSENGAARLFLSDLAPRALIVSGARRCSSPYPAACVGSSGLCRQDRKFALSDMAHATSNLFYAAHKIFNNRPAATGYTTQPTKFVQIHSYIYPLDGNRVVIADATAREVVTGIPDAISNRLEAEIDLLVPGEASTKTHSCQDGLDPGHNFYSDPSIGDSHNRCAEKNVHGRYTNNPNMNTCTGDDTSTATNRFLHLEATGTAADGRACIVWNDATTDTSRVTWRTVRAALMKPTTFGACDLKCRWDASTTCTLGPDVSSLPDDMTCP